jgi:hypothetical protein
LFDVWYFVQCQYICRSHVLAFAPLGIPRKRGILQLPEFSFVNGSSSQISNKKIRADNRLQFADPGGCAF